MTGGRLDSELRNRLRERRLALRMSQRYLAETVGTSQSNISDWEAGLVCPNIDNLMRWAEGLRTRISVRLESELRPIQPAVAACIGRVIGDPFVAFGHPLTCNGGNPDWETHHDHEVLMCLNDIGDLECPECGRVQRIPDRDITLAHADAWLSGAETHPGEEGE